MSRANEDWPELPLAAWKDTLDWFGKYLRA